MSFSWFKRENPTDSQVNLELGAEKRRSRAFLLRKMKAASRKGRFYGKASGGPGNVQKVRRGPKRTRAEQPRTPAAASREWVLFQQQEPELIWSLLLLESRGYAWRAYSTINTPALDKILSFCRKWLAWKTLDKFQVFAGISFCTVPKPDHQTKD